MAVLRAKNAVLLAKIEGTPGTEAAPSASTDAVLVENPRLAPTVNLIQTNEVTGSLDPEGPIVGGMQVTLSCDVYLKHSGSAGTAPEFGDLLKACGMAETVTGTAVPSSPEACANGGSTTLAILGSSASSTAQAYRGMPIDFTGNVSGSSFISDYTAAKNATLTDTLGGAITNTTKYQIPVNVLYGPSSATIPSLTMYLYMDGILYKLVGCRGTFQLGVEAGGVGRLSFTFTGLFLSKTDAAVVTPTYDSTRPPVFKGGTLKLNRLATAARALALDFGNTLAYPENPNATEGFDPGEITERRVTGSIDPIETLVATRDIMTDFRAGTRRILHARWGSSAGNRIGVTLPQAHYTGQTPSDRSGIMTVDVPFAAVGKDAGMFLCFY
jgi:hypothetical protein